jgi:hypothetical protein
MLERKGLSRRYGVFYSCREVIGSMNRLYQGICSHRYD